MINYPPHLRKLVQQLKRLPGVGNKSAERFAFELLNWQPHQLQEFARTVAEIPEKLNHCTVCGCLKEETVCAFCENGRRNEETICLVAFPKDVFAIEQTGEYRGLYHVLGGMLSPLEGISPKMLRLESLANRLTHSMVREMIIALDATLEGDATALWLKKEFSSSPIAISRLAFGLPMGSALDYVDGGTLARAFSGRGKF